MLLDHTHIQSNDFLIEVNFRITDGKITKEKKQLQFEIHFLYKSAQNESKNSNGHMSSSFCVLIEQSSIHTHTPHTHSAIFGFFDL